MIVFNVNYFSSIVIIKLEAEVNKCLITKSSVFVSATALFLSACSNNTTASIDLEESTENIVGMPNPSAVYCEGLGYPEESVERNGGMDADCIFPNGSRCGAWD